MKQKNIEDGEIRYVPQISEDGQIVYLDFDGESASYHNGDLGVDVSYVSVEDSGLTDERIQQITASLNEQFADRNVVFVTERPADGEYSTVYVGKTDAFDGFGSFAGLAETIDSGNRIACDNAFVLLDSSSSDSEIVSVVGHEIGHIVFGEQHDTVTGGLEDYAGKIYDYFELNRFDELYNNVKSTAPDLGTHSTSFIYHGDISGPDDVDYICFTSGVTGTLTVSQTESSKTEVCHDSLYSSQRATPYKSLEMSVTKGKKYYFVIQNYNLYQTFEDYYWKFSFSGSGGGSDQPVTSKLPDLTVTSARFSKSTITTEESARLNFTVKNAGKGSAGSFIINIFKEGSRISSVTVNSLAGGKSVSYYCTIPAGKLDVGTYTFYVIADNGESVTESNENNNTLTCVLTVKRSPSLSIQSNDQREVSEDLTDISTINVAGGTRETSIYGKLQKRTNATLLDVTFSGDRNASVKIGNFADVSAGVLSGNHLRTNKITVGSNSTLKADSITDFSEITVSGGTAYKQYSTDSEKNQGISKITVGKYVGGTNRTNKITAGSNTSMTFESIDFQDNSWTSHKNSISIGDSSSFKVTGTEQTSGSEAETGISDLSSLKTGNGKDGAETVVDIAGKIEGTAYSDTVQFGNHNKVTTGDISFSGGNDTLKIGNSSVAEIGAVEAANAAVSIGTVSDVSFTSLKGISRLTAANGECKNRTTTLTSVTTGDVTGTGGNDTIQFGDRNMTGSGQVNLQGGSDTIRIGSSSSCTFGMVYAEKLNVSVGARSYVKTGDVYGVSRFTTADDSQSTTNWKAKTIIDAGNINGTNGNDVVQFGKFSSVKATSIYLGSGKDVLKIGGYSEVQTGMILADTLTMTVDTCSDVTAGAVYSVVKLTVANGKVSTDKKTKVATVFETKLKTDNISGTDGCDTFQFGNYTNVTTGEIYLSKGKNTLKIGNGSTAEIKNISADAVTVFVGSCSDLKVTDDIFGLNKLTVAGGKYDKKSGITWSGFSCDTLYGTDGSDSIAFGKYVNAEIGSVNLKAGADTIDFGSGGKISISSLTVNSTDDSSGKDGLTLKNSGSTVSISALCGSGKVTVTAGSRIQIGSVSQGTGKIKNIDLGKNADIRFIADSNAIFGNGIFAITGNKTASIYASDAFAQGIKDANKTNVTVYSIGDGKSALNFTDAKTETKDNDHAKTKVGIAETANGWLARGSVDDTGVGYFEDAYDSFVISKAGGVFDLNWQIAGSDEDIDVTLWTYDSGTKSWSDTDVSYKDGVFDLSTCFNAVTSGTSKVCVSIGMDDRAENKAVTYSIMKIA